MSETLQKNILLTKNFFSQFQSMEARFCALIDMGKKLSPFAEAQKTQKNLVSGCQSHLYLSAELIDGKVFFNASCEALISAGLAALLISVYNGESPDTILQSSLDFLVDLNIQASLSHNRSNGLTSIHLRMKQEALQCLLQKNKRRKLKSS